MIVFLDLKKFDINLLPFLLLLNFKFFLVIFIDTKEFQ